MIITTFTDDIYSFDDNPLVSWKITTFTNDIDIDIL